MFLGFRYVPQGGAELVLSYFSASFLFNNSSCLRFLAYRPQLFSPDRNPTSVTQQGLNPTRHTPTNIRSSPLIPQHVPHSSSLPRRFPVPWIRRAKPWVRAKSQGVFLRQPNVVRHNSHVWARSAGAVFDGTGVRLGCSFCSLADRTDRGGGEDNVFRNSRWSCNVEGEKACVTQQAHQRSLSQ